MNKVITIIFCFFTIVAFGQVPKVTLIEQVTSASCPPCAAQNPGFDALLNPNLQKLAVIKYQRGGGSYADDMFDFNPGEVTARIPQFYGVSSFPNVWMNGVYFGFPGNMTQADIDNSLIATSFIDIKMDDVFVNDSSYYVGQGKVKFLKDFQDAADVNLKLFVVAVERVVNYTNDNPPGTNGELEFHWVMRKMLTGAGGMDIGQQLNGAEVPMNFSMSVDKSVINPSQLSMIAFVQRIDQSGVGQNTMPGTNEVLQAMASWKTQPTALPQPEDVVTQMAVYPTIANNAITTAFEIDEAKDIAIEIVNGLGQIVQTINNTSYAIGSHKVVLNVSDLSSGMYMVNIKSNGLADTKRFMIAN